MILTAELKAQIDGMDYWSMLKKWRFTPSGDSMFEGESGTYYKQVMLEKKDADPEGAVQDSKDIGW